MSLRIHWALVPLVVSLVLNRIQADQGRRERTDRDQERRSPRRLRDPRRSGRDVDLAQLGLHLDALRPPTKRRRLLGPVDRLARPRSNSSCIRPCFVSCCSRSPMQRPSSNGCTATRRQSSRPGSNSVSPRPGQAAGSEVVIERDTTVPPPARQTVRAHPVRQPAAWHLTCKIAVPVVVAEHREYVTQDSPRQSFAVADTDCMLVSEPGRWRVPGSTGSMRRDRIGPGPAR